MEDKAITVNRGTDHYGPAGAGGDITLSRPLTTLLIQIGFRDATREPRIGGTLDLRQPEWFAAASYSAGEQPHTWGTLHGWPRFTMPGKVKDERIPRTSTSA